MMREDALKLSETALADLATALQADDSEQLTQYLGMLSRFHHYSFGNIMMTYLQFPEATRVAGFGSWKKLGRHVKKGEKGIAILAPLLFKKKAEQCETDFDGKPKLVLRGFKVVHVFDVSQTEGKDLAEFAGINGDPGENLIRVKQLIDDEGISLSYERIQGGALGQSAGGAISVVPDLDAAEEFAVLVHELAHELLHKGDRRSETSKTVRETEAEAVSYVVATAVGLDTSTRSADYIRLYRGDAETLSDSLDHVQRAATRILSALEAPAKTKQLVVNV
ncbi:ArdC family protein [Planctomycetaceae bacterium SH139]